MHKQDVACVRGTYWSVIGKTSHDLYVAFLDCSAKRRVLMWRACDSPHKIERRTHRDTLKDDFIAMTDEPDTSELWKGLRAVVNGKLVCLSRTNYKKQLQCTGLKQSSVLYALWLISMCFVHLISRWPVAMRRPADFVSAVQAPCGPHAREVTCLCSSLPSA